MYRCYPFSAVVGRDLSEVVVVLIGVDPFVGGDLRQ
jgi:hypothetical protein